MNLEAVGKKIREARERYNRGKGITQAELAKRIHICRASYIDLEFGRKAPKWDKMVQLQKILGVKIKI